MPSLGGSWLVAHLRYRMLENLDKSGRARTRALMHRLIVSSGRVAIRNRDNVLSIGVFVSSVDEVHPMPLKPSVLLLSLDVDRSL
jgi:hypothetical protein